MLAGTSADGFMPNLTASNSPSELDLFGDARQ
jgi:hypothetical protein